MVYVAVLGYGVVGSGIWQVLSQNQKHIEKKAGQSIKVKRVLDIKEFPGEPVADLLTHNYEDILNDPEIQIVAEVMGGIKPAYAYVKKALEAGKHVVTSNKELVADHGAELLDIAEKNNINFLFEASVGGGIPIVRPMNLALTTDEIMGLSGILNGTANYILTQMNVFNKTFTEALEAAQKLGYAEKDPAADVKGYDACRKLAILLSLAAGRQVNYRDIHTEGIEDIQSADFDAAYSFGYTIKLLADGRITESGLEALVAPMLVHNSHPLYNVSDVFNGVFVQAKMTDNVLFTGRGAGKLPTAGAVVSDIVDIAKHLNKHILHSWSAETLPVKPASEYIKKKMVRAVYKNKESAIKTIKECMDYTSVCELPHHPGQLIWLSGYESEGDTHEKITRLARSGVFINLPRVLRVYEPMETGH